MGYGARALQALNAYYSGEYLNLDEESREEPSYPDASAVDDVYLPLYAISYNELMSISQQIYSLITRPFVLPHRCRPFYNDSLRGNPRTWTILASLMG